MRTLSSDGVRARSDRALFRRLHDPDDPLDAPGVVEQFLPLARSVARAHAHSADTFDDVYQVACLGLVKAVQRFDIDRRIAFSSYAVPTISGEIKRYYRDRTWAVRPPRGLQDLSLRVEREIEDWTARHGAAPSVGDLADALDLEQEDVLEALHAHGGRAAMSLDMPARGHDHDHATLGERLGESDAGFEQVEDVAGIEELLRPLPARDRMILKLRFERDMTQAEIARVCGLSQMQISRILRASLTRVRALALQQRA